MSAILRSIAARDPDAGLWPWGPREEARCAEWLKWLSSTIHVAFMHIRRAARCAVEPRAVEDVAATAKRTCRAPWQAVDVKIGAGPLAIGERYSVVDPCFCEEPLRALQQRLYPSAAMTSLAFVTAATFCMAYSTEERCQSAFIVEQQSSGTMTK